jgi:hypothetical protein
VKVSFEMLRGHVKGTTYSAPVYISTERGIEFAEHFKMIVNHLRSTTPISTSLRRSSSRCLVACAGAVRISGYCTWMRDRRLVQKSFLRPHYPPTPFSSLLRLPLRPLSYPLSPLRPHSQAVSSGSPCKVRRQTQIHLHSSPWTPPGELQESSSRLV